jgi:hypothetical protein
MDEAHRLAPREFLENEELKKIRSTLKDACRCIRDSCHLVFLVTTRRIRKQFR